MGLSWPTFDLYGDGHSLTSLNGAVARKILFRDNNSCMEVSVYINSRKINFKIFYPDDNNKCLRKKLSSYGVSCDDITIQTIGDELRDIFNTDEKLKIEGESSVDLGKALDNFNNYFAPSKDGKEHYVRQFCILNIFAPLLTNEMTEEDKAQWTNTIIYLQGESSIGKTVGLKFMMSFVDQYGDKTINCNFTANGLINTLCKNDGLPLVLDEFATMPSKLRKNISQLIYAIADGEEKKRYDPHQEYIDTKPSKYSVFITSEEDILRLIKPEDRKLGILGRMIGIHVECGDLADSTEHANDLIKNTTKDNFSILLEFIHRMEQRRPDDVSEYIYKETLRINSVFPDQANIIKRWYRYFAILSLTAHILAEVTGLQFDIDKMIEFSLEILNQQLDYFNGSDDICIARKIYKDALSYAEMEEVIGGVTYVLVSTADFKSVMSNIKENYGSKIKDSEVKDILNRDLRLLKETIAKVKNIGDKKSKRYYYIKKGDC